MNKNPNIINSRLRCKYRKIYKSRTMLLEISRWISAKKNTQKSELICLTDVAWKTLKLKIQQRKAFSYVILVPDDRVQSWFLCSLLWLSMLNAPQPPELTIQLSQTVFAEYLGIFWNDHMLKQNHWRHQRTCSHESVLLLRAVGYNYCFSSWLKTHCAPWPVRSLFSFLC